MKESLPSNRSFSLVFVVFFLLLAAMSWWKGGSLYPLLGALAVVVGGIGIFRPERLAPCNRAWMRLAEILHRVVNPVVLAILFFGVITPFALLQRIFRKDPLRRASDPTVESYWMQRDPPGPESGSMSNQF